MKELFILFFLITTYSFNISAQNIIKLNDGGLIEGKITKKTGKKRQFYIYKEGDSKSKLGDSLVFYYTQKKYNLKNKVNAEIELLDQSILKGQLLFANDSIFVIWLDSGNHTFHPNAPDFINKVVSAQFSKIHHAKLRRNSMAALTGVLGAGVGYFSGRAIARIDCRECYVSQVFGGIAGGFIGFIGGASISAVREVKYTFKHGKNEQKLKRKFRKFSLLKTNDSERLLEELINK